MSTISFRKATLNDMDMIYQWRNDPWIISLGSSHKNVSWEEHQAWFTKALNNPDMHLYVIEIDNKSAGQVRYQTDQSYTYITIYLLKDYTGKGFGTQIIQQMCQTIRQSNSLPVIAFIRQDNMPSIKSFIKSGFVLYTHHQNTPEHHVCYILR